MGAEGVTNRNFWIVFTACALVVVLALCVCVVRVHEKPWTSQELALSVKLVWDNPGWVLKPEPGLPHKVIPAIAFKVKNTGRRDLHFVKFTGEFCFLSEQGRTGHGLIVALQEGLAPGQVSKPLSLGAGKAGYATDTRQELLRSAGALGEVICTLRAHIGQDAETVLATIPVPQRIVVRKADAGTAEE